jgi:hypothetical protein
MLAYPVEIRSFGGSCGATPTFPTDAISDVRSYYDDASKQRVAVFYTKVHDRLLPPLLAANAPPAPIELRHALTTIDRHVRCISTTHASETQPENRGQRQSRGNQGTLGGGGWRLR